MKTYCLNWNGQFNCTFITVIILILIRIFSVCLYYHHICCFSYCLFLSSIEHNMYLNQKHLHVYITSLVAVLNFQNSNNIQMILKVFVLNQKLLIIITSHACVAHMYCVCAFVHAYLFKKVH